VTPTGFEPFIATLTFAKAEGGPARMIQGGPASPKVAASALPDDVVYCCPGSLVNPAELQDYIQVPALTPADDEHVPVRSAADVSLSGVSAVGEGRRLENDFGLIWVIFG
jgi:hypothetical protein